MTLAQFGDVAMLMNNAAIRAGDGKPWEDAADWRSVIDVNLMGVVHGVTAFTAAMIAQDQYLLRFDELTFSRRRIHHGTCRR
jgi:NADP-dependent 3-hydroxy acid dehydrogenase YdfG